MLNGDDAAGSRIRRTGRCQESQDSGRNYRSPEVQPDCYSLLGLMTDLIHRVFREIKILRNLSHVNVLAISEIFAVSCSTRELTESLNLPQPMCYEDFTAVFIVTDFYPADLSQALIPCIPPSIAYRSWSTADH